MIYLSIWDVLGFTQPEFLKNFWPNFWSSLIVGVVITSVIAKIISIRSKGKLSARAFFTGDRHIIIGARNIGNKAFLTDEINWNLYVPQHIIKPEDYPQSPQRIINGIEYVQFGGQNKISLFPKSATSLFEHTFPNEVEEVIFYYTFSTIYGYFPKSAAPDNKGYLDLSKETGRIHINVARREVIIH